MSKIEQIQAIIGVPVDGKWGPRSQSALSAILHPQPWRQGKASSFADPKDVERFHKWFAIYKGQGKSDGEATELAFGKGDNAIGCWDDSTAHGTGPSCALPPEDIEEKWGGSKATNWIEGKRKLVEVAANGQSIVCVLKDRMPHRANITNGAIIDLNPDAVTALGLLPPLMVAASWRWA